MARKHWKLTWENFIISTYATRPTDLRLRKNDVYVTKRSAIIFNEIAGKINILFMLQSNTVVSQLKGTYLLCT